MKQQLASNLIVYHDLGEKRNYTSGYLNATLL